MDRRLQLGEFTVPAEPIAATLKLTPEEAYLAGREDLRNAYRTAEAVLQSDPTDIRKAARVYAEALAEKRNRRIAGGELAPLTARS
jgi:hypothetical protein